MALSGQRPKTRPEERPPMASNKIDSEAAIWIIAGREKQPDKVEKDLRAAAMRVWPRAEAYARRELYGSALAEETSVLSGAWEDALQSVQCAHGIQHER